MSFDSKSFGQCGVFADFAFPYSNKRELLGGQRCSILLSVFIEIEELVVIASVQ